MLLCEFALNFVIKDNVVQPSKLFMGTVLGNKNKDEIV